MSALTTVLFGGPSPEHDISILTGLQCERVLAEAGVQVQSVYWARTGEFTLVPTGLEAADFVEGTPRSGKALTFEISGTPGFHVRKSLRSSYVDVGTVLNCCHGGAGENGILNGMLELAGIKATGGPSWAAALGMDKLAFGAVVTALGIPSLPRVALSADTAEVPFAAPYIVKPRFGGSSLGIEVVQDLDTARALARTSPALRTGAVLEPYREGAVDLNIAFRTTPTVECSLLERPLRGAERFYAYEEKYLQGTGLTSAPRELPAQVPDRVREDAERWTEQLVRTAGFTGVGRVDFLLSGDELLLNEVNTIPGAMALYLWPDSVAYRDLLLGMVQEAGRAPSAPVSVGQPGAALRVAGGIAQKLTRPTGR